MCNPFITFLPASLSEASWNCSPCFAQRKMKAWVSEQVQGQKLVSTREMQDVGGNGTGTGCSPVCNACRSKFKKWLRRTCVSVFVWVVSVCVCVLNVCEWCSVSWSVCLCICVYSCVRVFAHVLPCVHLYICLCVYVCKRRDRGGRGRVIRRQGGESVNKAWNGKAGLPLKNHLVHSKISLLTLVGVIIAWWFNF